MTTLLSVDTAAGGPVGPYAARRGRFFFSGIKGNNAVVVGRMFADTINTTTLRTSGSHDIHNNPALLILSDGTVLVASCDHGQTNIFLYRSTAPYALTFSAATTLTVEKPRYPVFVQDQDGLIWLFYNTQDPRSIDYRTSSDNGVTWSAATRLYEAQTAEEWSYFFPSLIDGYPALTTSRVHGGNTAGGDGYFFAWDGAAWRTASGTAYTLPITSATAEVMFDSSSAGNASFGFFVECAKDSAGTLWAIVSSVTPPGVFAGLYLCQNDGVGGWTQTAVSATVSPSQILGDYDLAVNSTGIRTFTKEASHWVLSDAIPVSGITRTLTHVKRIFGLNTPHLAFSDEFRPEPQFNWESDLKAPFLKLPHIGRVGKGRWVVRPPRSVSGETRAYAAVDGVWA